MKIHLPKTPLWAPDHDGTWRDRCAVHRDDLSSGWLAIDGETQDISEHRTLILGRGRVVAVAVHNPIKPHVLHLELAALYPLRVEDGNLCIHRHCRAQVGAGHAVELYPGIGGRDVNTMHCKRVGYPHEQADQTQHDPEKPLPPTSHGFYPLSAASPDDDGRSTTDDRSRLLMDRDAAPSMIIALKIVHLPLTRTSRNQTTHAKALRRQDNSLRLCVSISCSIAGEGPGRGFIGRDAGPPSGV